VLGEDAIRKDIDRAAIGHIELMAGSGKADLSNRGGRAVHAGLIAIRQDRDRARLGQGARHYATDTRSRPGDYRYTT
jgi:hypothetical protein